MRVLPAMAFVAWASAAMAADTITRDFATEAEVGEWSINFGTGAVAWDAANGVDGSGCLKVTLSAADPANKEVAPMWTIPGGPFNSSEYLTLEYDIWLDPTSGTDSEGKYFNLQEVFSDSTWSWDSHWVGAVGLGYAGMWTHMTVPVPNNAKDYFRAIFAMQGTAPYTGDVVVYIDNVTLKAQPNPLILENGTDETIGWSAETWATPATVERVTTEDAGGGYTPLGSLKISPEFNATDWQQSWIIHSFPTFDPRRWTYIEADVKVDAALSTPRADGGFGGFGFNVRKGNWDDAVTPTVNMDASWAGVWTHVKLPLPGNDSAGPLDIILNGNHGGPIVVYIDNIVMTKPIEQPRVGIRKAGPSGVEITMSDTGQWERHSLITPADATALGLLWPYQINYPVTYSFTIGSFPSPTTNPGFEAHMYLVNADTPGGSGSQTGGSPDWSASDVLIFRVQNEGAAVQASIHWKTNLPDANPPADDLYHPVTVDAPSAIGTWALTFNNETNATMTGPGITATNFTLPAEAVMNNFFAYNSYIQWGVFKNDGNDNGVNNFASGTFTSVKFTGSNYPIDDNFTGATLTNKYPWRVSSSTAVTYVPPGTAWWVNWSLPADNYTMESAPTVNGPWGSAGATNTLQRGAMMFAPIQSSALPAGGAAFFRLSKP